MSFVTIPFQSANPIVNLGDDHSSIRSGSFEGRKVVNMRANACKVAVAFTLMLIGSSYLGSYCFDDQDQEISGLTSRTYEAVNTALLIGLLTLQYTRPNGKWQNPFETGKICSYEFFASLIAVHMVTYSCFFLASSSTKDPLSAGIYGSSLATVLTSYASVYKEHAAACDLDFQDEYHCIENLPSSIEVNRSQRQSEDSVATSANSKICNIAKASIPLLWGIGSASFASLCFSGQKGLNPREYEAMSVGIEVALLTLQQMRSNKQLKSPLEEGHMCSYEFFAALVAANTLAYSLLFAANASKADPLSAAIFGGVFSATLNSYASAFKEHIQASKREQINDHIGTFFDYNGDYDRHVSVAINEDSVHSVKPNDAHGYTQSVSSRSAAC